MIDKRNLNFANDLIEISKTELKRSKRDYEHRDCSGAISSLQQSAEKAIKAYFVLMGFESEDLDKFRHDPINKNVLKGILMLFLGHSFRNQIVGYYISPIQIMPISDILKQAEFNKKQLLKTHLPLFDDRLKILKISESDINDCLNYPLDLDADYTDKGIQMAGELYLQQWDGTNKRVKKDKSIKTEIDKHFLKLYGKNSKEYFEECYTEIYTKIDWKIKKTEEQKYKSMIETLSENITRNIKWSMKIRNVKPLILIYICLITGPHLQSQSVRYPKGKENRLEPSDYKKGLGIVDAYPKIHDKLEKCIEFIEFIKIHSL